MSDYEMAEYIVLVSHSGRSHKAHIENLDKLAWTLCGQRFFATTYRQGEDVCLRCSHAADRLDGLSVSGSEGTT